MQKEVSFLLILHDVPLGVKALGFLFSSGEFFSSEGHNCSLSLFWVKFRQIIFVELLYVLKSLFLERKTQFL